MSNTSDLDDAIKNSIHRSLDPHFVYDARARILESESAGVERLLYKILGPEFISSFAFAIDPFHSFRRIPKVESKRLRTRLRSSVLHGKTRRRIHFTSRGRTYGTYQLPGFKWSDFPEVPYTVTNDTLVNLNNQGEIPDFITDSTNRSRLKGSIGGPLELFKYSLHSSPVSWVQRTNTLNAIRPGPQTKYDKEDSREIQGAAGYMDVSDIRTIVQREKSDAAIAIQGNIDALLARVTPTSKLFGLARSIGELKDFRHLGNYKTYTEATRRRAAQAKDTPDLFLSLEFGLAPLISDIKTLLNLPTLVAKRMNKLIARSGKPTSYRSKLKLNSDFNSPPAFKFDYTGSSSYDISKTTTAFRDREVRIAVNSTFEFPPVELPQLRRDLSARLYGADIDFKTLYDLVPWSWLVDWFTGFGDYLNVIEAINTDPSLVNYGFVTYKSAGTLLTQQTWKYDDLLDLTYHNPEEHYKTVTKMTRHVAGKLEWQYQLRKSIGDLGVSTVSEGVNLSPFQTLILGALTAQRGFHW